jgi:hypothetical protein
VQRQCHRVQHPHHAITDVMSDHCIDVVLAQEPSHPGVMSSRRTFIVQRAPRDLDLSPIFDLAVNYLGNRNPVGATPTGVDLSINRYRNAYNHV